MDTVAARTHRPSLHLELNPITWSRPFAWLRLGAADLRLSLRASIAHGLGMVLLGWLLLGSLGTSPYFIAAAVTGFLLVAPVMSTGLCELSRRLERGERPTFDDSLAPLLRDGTTLVKFGVLLAVIALGWFLVSEALLRPVFSVPSPSLIETLYRGFFEQMTPGEFVAYVAVGGTLALAVFAVSVISIPVILDRHASASQAIGASLEVVRRQPLTMFVWAALIVVLTAIGFATMLIGMAVIIPVLGHATWRAYRDLVRSGVSPISR